MTALEQEGDNFVALADPGLCIVSAPTLLMEAATG